jgi:hypothetical protein
MYLNSTRSSPAGKRALHFKQATLPRCQLPGNSIVTILYFARQLGQLNGIGSELFMSEIKKKTNARASDCSDENGPRPEVHSAEAQA